MVGCVPHPPLGNAAPRSGDPLAPPLSTHICKGVFNSCLFLMCAFYGAGSLEVQGQVQFIVEF